MSELATLANTKDVSIIVVFAYLVIKEILKWKNKDPASHLVEPVSKILDHSNCIKKTLEQRIDHQETHFKEARDNIERIKRLCFMQDVQEVNVSKALKDLSDTIVKLSEINNNLLTELRIKYEISGRS